MEITKFHTNKNQSKQLSQILKEELADAIWKKDLMIGDFYFESIESEKIEFSRDNYPAFNIYTLMSILPSAIVICDDDFDVIIIDSMIKIVKSDKDLHSYSNINEYFDSEDFIQNLVDAIIHIHNLGEINEDFLKEPYIKDMKPEDKTVSIYSGYSLILEISPSHPRKAVQKAKDLFSAFMENNTLSNQIFHSNNATFILTLYNLCQEKNVKVNFYLEGIESTFEKIINSLNDI